MTTKYRLQILTIVLCIFFWFFAAIFINPYSPFTTIMYMHSLSQQGDKANTTIGSFTAEENNLGIIGIRVVGEIKPNSTGRGLIAFALREKNNSHTLYSTTTEINQVNEKGFLVFGFPSIVNSKGKQYEFVISTTNDYVSHLLYGEEGNFFTSKYIYSRQSLRSSRDAFVFFIKRTRMLFSNSDALLSSGIYLFPLCIFFLYTFYKKVDPKVKKVLKDKMQSSIQKLLNRLRKRIKKVKKITQARIYTIKENENISIFPRIKNKHVRYLCMHMFFLIFSIVVLFPILLDPHVVKTNDLNGTDLYQIYFRTAVRQYHSFPQWNPYMQQGLPLVADPMQGMYNPVISIPIIFMPTYDMGIKVIYILSLFLACETMFFLTKEFTKSSSISIFIALTYATSGYAGARLVAGHIESFVPYCIIPFLILSLYKVVTKKNFFWSGLLAFSFTYILFSGSIYFLAYGFYCVLGLLVYYFFKDRKAFFFLCLSIFLFLLFSSIKLFPILELQNSLGKIKEPFLGSQTIVSIMEYLFVPFDVPFKLLGLGTFLSPEWGTLEKIAFIGIFPFVGLVWVVKNIKRIKIPQKTFLIILFVVCFLILMPGWVFNPFHWVIELVPTLQFFRVPSRAFAFLIVIILLLFGIFSRILADNKKFKRFIIPMLCLNLLLTCIFFETLLIKPEIIAYPVYPANIALYNNLFSWLEKHNTSNTYVLAEISQNEVPENIAFYHNQRLLNTNYGFMLKNSPAAHFADIERPSPFSYAYRYTDIRPGYFINPHNQVIDIPTDAKKVYQTGDTSIYQLPAGRPFAMVEDTTENYATVSATFGLNNFRIKTIANGDQMLSLSEMSYPGWSVTIDGKKAQLENNRFLQVKTKQGSHVYVFSFASKTFLFGFLISTVSLVGFLLWLGITFFLKRSVFLAYL